MPSACSLHDAAIAGDANSVRRLMDEGTHVNATDDPGNSIIGALVMGASSFDEIDASCVHLSASGRLSILSFLLDQRAFSLYTLNTSQPCLNGLTPLGMAAYLDQLDFVVALLEKGEGLVLVDGIDSHRATPTMYAARDGHDEILEYLILHGARPDSLDCHHRSVCFYAMAQPQCLWTIERTIRLQRSQALLCHKMKRKWKIALQQDIHQYISLATLYQRHRTMPYTLDELFPSVNRLVHAINRSDALAVHSILFPSISDPAASVLVPSTLVNLPDERGWSPIHYCVAAPKPSARVLDTLFLAGADLSLYTADNISGPLHILARYSGTSDATSFRLYAFIVHLVRDLQAPLDAVDSNGNTCIHVAAQYGQCMDVLMAFLECDSGGEVRNMLNKDGLTALDVAKAEFRMAFEPDENSVRSDSVASFRTVKPSFSSSSFTSSISSVSSGSSSEEESEEFTEQFPPALSHEKECIRAMLSSSSEAEELLENLDYIAEKIEEASAQGSSVSPCLSRTEISNDMVNLDDLEAFLKSNWQEGLSILVQFRSLVRAELDDLTAVREVIKDLDQRIVRLERHVRAELKPGHGIDRHMRAPSLQKRPSVASFRSSLGTPSLIPSGASSGSGSSHSSFGSFVSFGLLKDLATIPTPAGSPKRISGEVHVISSLESNVVTMEGASRSSGAGELELDFECAIATASTTRLRSMSSSGVNVAQQQQTPLETPDLPLEPEVNIVSVSPARAPEMTAVGCMQVHHDSWLSPIIRKANRDTFEAHLANLLEIERTLFGDEDGVEDGVEGEESASCDPHAGEVDAFGDWREAPDSVEDERNFLEMTDGDGIPTAEIDEQMSSADPEDSSSSKLATFEVLRKIRHEVELIDDSMNTAEKSIDSAQQYINQAERLVNKVFQTKGNTIQAARLELALRDLCDAADTDDLDYEDVYVSYPPRRAFERQCAPAPAPSPTKPLHVSSRSVGVGHPKDASSLLLSGVTETRRRSLSLPEPPGLRSGLHQSTSKPSVRPRKHSSRPSLTSNTTGSIARNSSCQLDDARTLRRLLVRRIPAKLDSAVEEVDHVCAWVGIIQAVVRNLQVSQLL